MGVEEPPKGKALWRRRNSSGVRIPPITDGTYADGITPGVLIRILRSLRIKLPRPTTRPPRRTSK